MSESNNDIPEDLEIRILLVLYCYRDDNPGDPKMYRVKLFENVKQLYFWKEGKAPEDGEMIDKIEKLKQDGLIEVKYFSKKGDIGSFHLRNEGTDAIKDFFVNKDEKEILKKLKEAFEQARINEKPERVKLTPRRRKIKIKLMPKKTTLVLDLLQNKALSDDFDIIQLLQVARRVQPSINTLFNTSLEFFIAFEKHLIQAIQITQGIAVMAHSSLAPKLFQRVSTQLQKDMEILQQNHKEWQEIWIDKPVIQNTIDCLERMQSLMNNLSILLKEYEDYIQFEVLDLCQEERKNFVRTSKKLGELFKDLGGQLIGGSPPNIRDLNLSFNELQYYSSHCCSWLDELTNKSQKFQQTANG